MLLSITVLCTAACAESIPVAMAQGTNYYAAADVKGQLLLYDAGNYVYSLISPDGKVLSDMPSLTLLEESESMSRYRSGLTLACDGESVYAVELTVRTEDSENIFEAAELYRLDFSSAASTRVCALDLREAIYEDIMGENCARCLDALMADGQLLLLFEDPSAASGQGFDFSSEQILLCFDVSSGEKDVLALENCTNLLAYLEDQLLFARNAGEEMQIVRQNLRDGKEKIMERISTDAPIRIMAIASDLNTLDYVVGNQLYGWYYAEESKNIGRLPFFDAEGLVRLDEQTLAAYTQDQAAILPIDWNYTPTSNRLSIEGDKELAAGFAALHPEIDTQMHSGKKTNLTDVLLNHSPQPDVFILNAYKTPYQEFRNRGYLLPLKSAKLEAYAARLHPDLKAAACGAEGLCAIPLSMQTQPLFGVNLTAWDADIFGPLPQSWMELLDFLERWPKLRQSCPDLQLMTDIDGPEHLQGLLLERIIAEYDCWRDAQAEPMGYDTELFRSLVGRLNALDYEILSEYNYGEEATVLLTPRCIPSLNVDYGFTTLPLGLTEALAPQLRAIVTFAAINPYSENIEAATAFLEYCADTVAPIERIEMMPGENAPLRSENYEEDLAMLLEQVEALEQRIAQSTDPADIPPLQAQLEEARQYLAGAKNAWMVSEEDISAYRALSGEISVLYLQELSEEERLRLYELRTNYTQGNLSLDDFVRQMDRRIRMKELENQ